MVVERFRLVPRHEQQSKDAFAVGQPRLRNTKSGYATMNGARDIRLRYLQGQLGEIAFQLTKVQFTQFSAPSAWQPAINAYRYDSFIKICVDLAGVNKESIDLRVEPGRLVLRGRRAMPEPGESIGKCVRVLAMEIDHGPFERAVLLPDEVEINGVTASQDNGLLWINLPVRSNA